MTAESLLGFLLVLCLGVLASAAWTLAVRVRRAEEDLRRLRGLDLLNDRAATLADAVGRLDLTRIEGSLRTLVDAVPRLEKAIWRIEETLPRLRAGGEDSGSEGLRDAIEARLRDLGFERIRVCAPEAPAVAGEQGWCEVAVEASRGDVAHKGRVLVRGGVVGEVQIRPVYGLFP